MATAAKTYDEIQNEFDVATGETPHLGEGEVIPPGQQADQGGAVPPRPGWPPELFGALFAVAFRAFGEKWRLNEEEKSLLGRTGKEFYDSIRPTDKQGPLSALLAALLTVIIAKVGAAELEKQLAKATAERSTGESTETANAAGESSSAASPTVENPELWNPS